MEVCVSEGETDREDPLILFYFILFYSILCSILSYKPQEVHKYKIGFSIFCVHDILKETYHASPVFLFSISVL